MDTSRSGWIRRIPNCITCLRILATAVLLFLPPLTPAFFLVYTLAGATDALDGWLARRLNATSTFGSKLDSAADLFFYAVMIVRIFPVLWAVLPRVIWLAVAAVVLLRLTGYAVAAIRLRRFYSPHTILNKVTGAMVFAMPYIVRTSVITPYCWSLALVSGTGTMKDLLACLRAAK